MVVAERLGNDYRIILWIPTFGLAVSILCLYFYVVSLSPLFVCNSNDYVLKLLLINK